MKATELRIGNWVKRDGQLDGFQIDSHSFWKCERQPETYNPILLTDQWFKDFGFKQDETKRIWGKDGIMLIRKLRRLPFCLIGYNNSICKYVHQLQNLYFALTGKELTKKQK